MRSPWNGGSISRRRARCSRALEQQHRARAHDRPQRERAPGRQAVLALGVERPDRLRVGEHHHRRLEAEEAHAERVAEAPPAGLQERDRPHQPAQRLQHRRQARSSRQAPVGRGHLDQYPPVTNSLRPCQLGRQALGMAARADLREEAVRLAELSLAPLLVAALARQLGELDVDQRLERLRARVARQLERARERRLDLRTGGGAGRAEQDPRQRQARM